MIITLANCANILDIILELRTFNIDLYVQVCQQQKLWEGLVFIVILGPSLFCNTFSKEEKNKVKSFFLAIFMQFHSKIHCQSNLKLLKPHSKSSTTVAHVYYINNLGSKTPVHMLWYEFAFALKFFKGVWYFLLVFFCFRLWNESVWISKLLSTLDGW